MLAMSFPLPPWREQGPFILTLIVFEYRSTIIRIPNGRNGPFFLLVLGWCVAVSWYDRMVWAGGALRARRKTTPIGIGRVQAAKDNNAGYR